MEKISEFSKSHPDFPSYIVTKDGHIISKKTGRKLQPSIDPRGYYYVDLFENKLRTKMRVHVLVGETFLRKRVVGSEVIDHNDGNKKNCKLSNLEIVSYSMNTARAYCMGLVKNKLGRNCPK